MRISEILNEGGKAIEGAVPVTPESFKVVMQNLKKMLPELNFYPVGSAGQKPLSGDVDVFVDTAELMSVTDTTKPKDARLKLEKQLQNLGLSTSKSGVSVHVGIPTGEGSEIAQVDIMTVDNAAQIAPLHQHDYSEDPKMKGGALFPMISDLAKAADPDYKLSPYRGLVSRETDELITLNKDEIAKRVLGDWASADDISSVKKLLRATENHPELKQVLQKYTQSVTESVSAFADKVKQELDLDTFILQDRGDDIYLSSIIVGRDKQKRGLGSKAMEKLTQYADEHGKRVILTPAIQDRIHGTTSRARLVRFYKQFGFVESKGKNIDYEIGAGKMYRDPKGK